MSKEVENWLGKIIAHYGSVDDFPDARTVRIMRGFAVEELTQCEGFVRDAKPGTKREIASLFKEEIERSRTQIGILDDWLKQRGLEP